VQGLKVAEIGYTAALDLMKGAERPLTLKFRDPAAEQAKEQKKKEKATRKRER